MPAKLIRGLNNITPAARGGVITIGNFDGVHLGHQALIRQVIAEAKSRQVPSLAVTFEPHAFEFFGRENLTIPRLTRLREKFTALAECGLDNVIIIKFNQKLASISASDFVTKMLLEKLHPQYIFVGDDFRFGRDRQGDFALLKQMGEVARVAVQALPTVMVDGERVSSTRVRKALAEGNHRLAEKLLGHPYSMLGRVAHG
ncbi:MAG: hypothetical protein ACD_46C00541G0007, partial [uncultured bacterium]